MAKRAIDVYWDVVENIHRDASGSEIKKNEFPFVRYKEQVIVSLRLVTDGDNTAFTGLDGTEEYGASLAADFAHDAIMAKTLDAGINVAGEWNGDSSGTADPTQGEFAIEIDADTNNFNTQIGTVEEKKNGVFELRALDGSSSIVFTVQMPFRLLNILDDDSSEPTAQSTWGLEEFEEAGEKKIRLRNSDGIELVVWEPPV